jgi:DNA mismatch endonuclease (patch repair protein)
MKETPEQRSRIMRAVKSADTVPELIVRRLVHGMGYRFRLHRKDLPGKPDLIFPRLRKVVFVNGCFWHGHDCARGARVPARNREYWIRKVARNMERDRKTLAALKDLGWESLVVWECELNDRQRIGVRMKSFLEDIGVKCGVAATNAPRQTGGRRLAGRNRPC